MTTQWACPQLPSEGTDSRCCFRNATCAEYVCGYFGSNITYETSSGIGFSNCLVSNGTLATELYKNPPANGTCSFQTSGNGCLIRTFGENGTNITPPASSSGSMASQTSSSVSASASASSGSGSTSNALPQLMGVNQSILLGIVGFTWLIKRFCH
ncbi:uncharacterized protein L201_000324 [Kwoniella dendrophila CBS 6074]|uniref:Extracellular membrane protein CFEM domain-containing protein n=1 Tax=Kwoniella dendrophila CBS 6074 TaxID=1295534 RepID=A0AAX4JKE0_9TREE